MPLAGRSNWSVQYQMVTVGLRSSGMLDRPYSRSSDGTPSGCARTSISGRSLSELVVVCWASETIRRLRGGGPLNCTRPWARWSSPLIDAVTSSPFGVR